MAVSKAYINYLKTRGMLSIGKNPILLFIIFFSLSLNNLLYSQEEQEYDEISVFIDIPRVGAGEISAVIKGEDLYLPIIDLFDFLKIKNIPSFGLESVSGFFIDADATYIISRIDNRIVFKDKTFNLDPGDLVKTESNLYLKIKYFGDVFGLDCVFNFRSLSITLTSKIDLPVIREMQREEMRKNLNRLKGETKADTTIERTHPLFKFGTADWAVDASEEIEGISETRLNLALGAMIAGGEANASLTYNSKESFDEKQQYYLWRYVNNDFGPLKQIMAGKIATQAFSTLNNPVIGVQLTNTPTTYRRSFGSYTLSDRTEPGWIVELYVNNVLVDYAKADASGFFSFQVPLVYGNSIVQLKFYGPWGEERVREQNINIPFTFLPVNTMEYNIGAGIVEDSLRSRFSRARLNYGISRRLTIGAGYEYLSSLLTTPGMPFINASLGLTNNLLLSGEYTYGVRAKGTLSYRLPSNLQLDINYTWYEKNQKAIFVNYREDRKATLSMPLKIGNFSSFQRFSFNQIILPLTEYINAEWLFSGSLFGASTNLTTAALFSGGNKPSMYSNLSMAFRFPGGFVIMPQTQYQYSDSRFISAKVRIEKHLLDYAYLNISFEQLFKTNVKMAEIGLRYDFSFAQAGFSVQRTDKKTAFIEYARGSLINDTKTKFLGTDNRTNVGKGGISIVPFIDFNVNGRKDPGEPKAYGLNLRANSGRIEKSERDTVIRIIGLEPYTSCFIELDQNSFENLAWRLQKRTLSVVVDPNILKTIEVPIMVAGEANGIVSLIKEGEVEANSIGRIIINFFNANMKPAGRTISEDDGFYSNFGLPPGKYIVMPDTNQMKKLRMTSDPKSFSFDIKGGIDGDIVDGLDFTLRMMPEDTTIAPEPVMPVAQQRPAARKDTTYMIIHEITQELVTITEDSYAIQLGAFKMKSNADALRRKLEKVLGRSLEIIVADGFYKVRIPDMKERSEVDANVAILGRNGISELWVVSLKAKQQQWVLTERQDTVTEIKEFVRDRQVTDLTPYMSIQAGAFRREADALKLRDQLVAKLDKKVDIVSEGGLYKVRITGFATIDEMERMLPALGLMGMKDVWRLPIRLPVESPVIERRVEIRRDSIGIVRPLLVQPDTARRVLPEIILPDTAQAEIPAVILPDTARVEIPTVVIPEKKLFEMPVVEKPDTTLIEMEEIPEIVVAEEETGVIGPTFSLHAGVFYKESQAIKAQNKIMSKLKLPAVIVQQWDSFHVVIPGFYTRQETYRYYPELAGLGFSEIYVIEKK